MAIAECNGIFPLELVLTNIGHLSWVLPASGANHCMIVIDGSGSQDHQSKTANDSLRLRTLVALRLIWNTDPRYHLCISAVSTFVRRAAEAVSAL